MNLSLQIPIQYQKSFISLIFLVLFLISGTNSVVEKLSMENNFSTSVHVAEGPGKLAVLSNNLENGNVVHAYITNQESGNGINLFLTRFGKRVDIPLELSQIENDNDYHSLDLCVLSNTEFLLVYSAREYSFGESLVKYPYRIRAQKFNVNEEISPSIALNVANNDDYPFTHPRCSGLQSSKVAIVFQTGTGYETTTGTAGTGTSIDGTGISLQIIKIDGPILTLFNPNKPYFINTELTLREKNQQQVVVGSNGLSQQFMVAWAGSGNSLNGRIFIQGFDAQHIDSENTLLSAVSDQFRINDTQNMGQGSKPSLSVSHDKLILAFDKPVDPLLSDGTLYPKIGVFDLTYSPVCTITPVVTEDGFSNIRTELIPGGQKVQMVYTQGEFHYSKKLTIEGCTQDTQTLVLERTTPPSIAFYGVQGVGFVLSYTKQEGENFVYYFNELLFYGASTGSCSDNCSICVNNTACGYCQGSTPIERKYWMNPDTNLCDCQSNIPEMAFYIKADSVDCGRCDQNCGTCSSDNGCDTCKTDGWALPQCSSCNNGYYETSDADCAQCNLQCSTCETGPDNCITCATGRDFQDSCNTCLPEYYMDGQFICQSCAPGCDDCDTDNTCNSCSVLNKNPQVLCTECIDGFYTEGDECQACNAELCQTCRLQPDNCLICVVGRDKSTSCSECLPNYYKEAGQNVCIECNSNCSECTASDACQACIQPGRDPQLQCGECLSTHFRNQQGDCDPCDIQCGTCDTSSNNCTSCKSTQDGTFNTITCLCEDGYFLNQDGICKQCDPQCVTCTQSSDKCTSCQVGGDMQAFPPCSSCVDGYLSEGVQCLPCSEGCQTCTQEVNTCDTCKENIDFSTGDLNFNCACNSNYFWNSPSSGFYPRDHICEQCDSTCQECEGQSSNCTVCATPNKALPWCSECMDGYYWNSTSLACEECHERCGTCSTIDICSTCKVEQQNLIDPNSDTCECIANHFFQDSSGISVPANCLQCEPKCNGCNSATECIECTDTNKVLPKCSVCQDGFFENGNPTCDQCDTSKCTTCETSENNCTQCASDNFQIPACDTCEPGYYQETPQLCLGCDDQCETCDNTPDNCTSCPRENAMTPSCECKPGYFENTEGLCEICDLTVCSECSGSATDCTVCAIQNTNIPNCSCDIDNGFFVQDNIGGGQSCLQCNDICATCDNDTTCSTCKVEGAQGSNCECNGWVDTSVNSDGICQSCNSYCETCDNAQTCLTCRLLNADDVTCQCTGLTYENDSLQECSSCDSKCSECDNQSGNCTSCVDQYSDPEQNCNECLASKYFDNIQNSCQKCPEFCVECHFDNDLSAPVCTLCSADKLLPSSKCKDCEEGYWFDDEQTYQCKECTEKFDNCDACNFDSCLTCSDNYYLNQQTMNCVEIPQCEEGQWFDDQETYLCQKCSETFPNCASCNSENCETCSEDYYLNSQIMRCVQIPECEENQWFDTQETYLCQDCSEKFENCEICTFDSCTTCSQNYQYNQETFVCDYRPQINYETAICDVSNINVVDKRCAECDFSNWQCTSCNKQQFRKLKNGVCQCDIFYVEDPNSNTCKEEPQFIQQETLQTTVKVAGATAGTAAATGLIFFNPGLLLSILDTLQQIGYIKFLQIDYPILVTGYLEIFEMFDFDLFPNIVPEKKYHMDSRQGFANQETDALLFRNTSQYIILILACLGIYLIFKSLQKFLFPSGNGIAKKAVDKIVGFFEFQVLVGGMVASYLNFTVFCYLQLVSSNVEDITQFSSLSMGYFVFIAESILPFIILHVAKKYVLIHKQVTQHQQKLVAIKNGGGQEEKGERSLIRNTKTLNKKIKKLESEREALDDKWGVLFEEYKQENILQAGFFAIVGFRKIIFAFNLVVLNNFPYANLSIFIILTLTEIFYFIKIKPQKYTYHVVRDVITQLSFLVIYGASFPFLDENITDSAKINCSVIIIVAVTLILVVEFLFFILDYIVVIYETIKAFMQKKKKGNSDKVQQQSSDESLSDDNNSQSMSDGLSSKNIEDSSKLTQTQKLQRSERDLSVQNSFSVFQNGAEMSEIILN